jgi:hypothetical protein
LRDRRVASKLPQIAFKRKPFESMLEYDRHHGRGAVIAAKTRLLLLAAALDVSVATSVRHDDCGDPRIVGRDGHIYADGGGFLIVCRPGRNTAHRWMNVKRRLAFCRVTQDGDDEGCLRLDHLPDAREADEISRDLRRNARANPEGQAGKFKLRTLTGVCAKMRRQDLSPRRGTS